ncbi:MAG: Crp/Fnr family transcriptional regulator [Rhodospirillales bacterium]|nr:Crp/Fnr family transcriptional regulator [Rhodospirillales bacterium]MDH3910892.1 Crp/Fnr family transcriptional regulator [Rhodospirillales bacterium]MDH3917248.1 Crp/Fnr family transcriptional regulator [Rhodospirillales bacterium]MDH3966109.1 Crp/Fnr family transcriptional regulator [Rhodospirillales bacterium]
MQVTADSLAGIGLLHGLCEADLGALAKRCSWRRYQAHEQIIHFHDDTRDVYFVVEGEVRAITYSLEGKEVTYRDIPAGGMFGEYAAIDGKPRSATIKALVPSYVAAMPATCFWEVLENHPSANAIMLKQLTRQVRTLTDRVFEFSTLAVKNRIHAELLRLARDHIVDEETAVIVPSPTHADIASRISTHREAVTRELTELSRQELVERRHGSLVVRDVPRLERMVAEVLGD